jgi:hypothetical protein
LNPKSFPYSVIQSVLIIQISSTLPRDIVRFFEIIGKADPFLADKWSGKETYACKLLINTGMPCKLFAVVKMLTLTPASKGLRLSAMSEQTKSDVFFCLDHHIAYPLCA